MTLPAFLLAFESSNWVWLGCKRHALPAVNARWSLARLLVLVVAQTLLGVALGCLISFVIAGKPLGWVMWLLGLFAACQSIVMRGLAALCWNQRAARLHVNPDLPLGLPPARSRLLRWALGLFYLALLAGITPLAMLVTVENVYGELVWRRERARLVAQGERLTMREILGPEIPAEQNAGAAPIFAPFFDYVPTDLPGEGGYVRPVDSSNAVARIEERLRRPAEHLPARPKDALFTPKENLADWSTAYRKLVAVPSIVYPSWAAKLKLPAPGDPARDVLAALAVSDAEIAAICAASALPRAQFPVHWDEGFQGLQEHLAVLKSAQINLLSRCAAHLSIGETDAAFADATNALNVAELLREEPLFISQLVRYAQGAISIRTLWQGLADHRWADAQLEVFQDRLGRVDYLPGLIRAFEGERACAILASDTLIARSLNPRDEGEEGTLSFHILAKITPLGVVRQNQMAVTRLYSSLLEDMRARLTNASHTGLTPLIKRQAEEAFVIARTPYSPFTALAKLLAPAFANAKLKIARLQTTIHLAIVACALERHRLAHGSYPETLDALVPAFMPKPPLDPMTAQPFHYRRTDDGWFLLFSVGYNGKDDGGVFRVKDLREDQDWPWPVPTRPALMNLF